MSLNDGLLTLYITRISNRFIIVRVIPLNRLVIWKKSQFWKIINSLSHSIELKAIFMHVFLFRLLLRNSLCMLQILDLFPIRFIGKTMLVQAIPPAFNIRVFIFDSLQIHLSNSRFIKDTCVWIPKQLLRILNWEFLYWMYIS